MPDKKQLVNGAAGPATYSVPPRVPEPPKQVTYALPGEKGALAVICEQVACRSYAAGLRRAAKIIAPAVGRLDAAGKKTIGDLLDVLEAELAVVEAGPNVTISPAG
jgi:hypothetical protein